MNLYWLILLAAVELTVSEHLQNTYLDSNSKLINIIKKHLDERNRKVNELKGLQAKLKEMDDKITDEYHLSLNPLTACLLIKRLVIDIEPIRNLRDYKNLSLPTHEDFETCVLHLENVRETYIHKIDPFNYAPPFCLKITSEDLFQLGKQSYLSHNFRYAIYWLETALDMEIVQKDSEKFVEKEILEYLAMSYYLSNNIHGAIKHLNRILFQYPTDFKALLNRRFFQSQLNRDANEDADEYLEEKKFNVDFYHQICRKRRRRVKELKKCYLWMNSLLIYKIEEMNLLKPDIVLIHDILSTQEIDQLKMLATPKFHFRKTFVTDDEEEVTETALIFKDDDENVMRIYARLQHLINLDLNFTDTLHVSKYRNNAHFLPHYDIRTQKQSPEFDHEDKGQRLATVLFYVST